MLHKTPYKIQTSETPSLTNVPSPRHNGLHIATRTEAPAPAHRALDLVLIVSRRCSSFFAEAAVLVLVFGILDYFMLKGRIELPWILGALAISIGLLALSVATDFAAHIWTKAHP